MPPESRENIVETIILKDFLFKVELFNHKHCVNFLYSVAFFILYETPIDVILSIIPIKWCKNECKINKVYFHFIHCLTNILGTNSYHKINTLTSFKKLRTQRDVKLIFQYIDFSRFIKFFYKFRR